MTFYDFQNRYFWILSNLHSKIFIAQIKNGIISQIKYFLMEMKKDCSGQGCFLRFHINSLKVIYESIKINVNFCSSIRWMMKMLINQKRVFKKLLLLVKSWVSSLALAHWLLIIFKAFKRFIWNNWETWVFQKSFELVHTEKLFI